MSSDEGGDPACWAHLFEEPVEEPVEEPDEESEEAAGTASPDGEDAGRAPADQ